MITRGRLYSVVGSWRLIRIILNVGLLLPRTIDAVVLYRAGPVGLDVLRHASIGGRCELDVRTSLWRVLGLRLTHLGNGRRQAAVGLNGLLLLYEGYRNGRRWRPGHDGAFLKPRWRSCRTRSASAKYASLLRRYRWSGRTDLRRGYFALIDLDHVSSDRLRRGEILLRCGGYPIRRRLVHILDVRNVFVNHHVVVVIVYDGVVHRRIGDVHVCHVSAAYVIGRHEDLTRPKWEPGHADSTASSDADAYAEVWSANPGDKRRSVNRTHIGDTDDRARRAWHPTPNSGDRHPAAVMERRKTPGSIIYPSPAPGRNPHPVAVAIRRPTDNDGVGEPNGAVLGHRAPASVVVEVFVANHIGRDVARGLRAIFAAVAVTAPVVEVVIVIAESLNVGIKLVGAGKRAGFSRMNGISRAATCDFSFTVAHNNESGIACFVDVDLVVARTEDGESKVGGIDFDRFILFEMPHAQVKGAFGEPDLRHAIIQIQKRKTSVAGKADRCGADVQLGACAVVGPKLVAGSNGPVDDRGNPIVGASRIKRNGAASVAQSRHAAWRIVIIISRGALRRKESRGQQNAEKGRQFEHVFSHF
ncbi:MAG: hypothetical protein DMG53_24570 [Acidobacteria bacterium]|nr:MAG: hypothetical protein DMG53_24570 [Acidobacteriota bacterium]PYU75686.1 MAG: hypothetical protein DMG52_06540 [Acidobacteriota bacterium]